MNFGRKIPSFFLSNSKTVKYDAHIHPSIKYRNNSKKKMNEQEFYLAWLTQSTMNFELSRKASIQLEH